MGNRRSASMVVPPARQFRYAKFNREVKNVSRRPNLPNWMQQIARAIRWTIWTTSELGIEASEEPAAELHVKIPTKVIAYAECAETRLLVVLKFFVPGHLNRFELSFVRQFRVASKPRKFHDPFVHIRKTHRQRVHAGMFLRQLDSDFLGIVPIKRVRHSLPLPASRL